MTPFASPDGYRNRLLTAVGGLALLVIIAAALMTPQAAAQGWLVAFVMWSGIPIGSLALLLIHRLTGGRWGEALAPVLKPLVATLPLLIVAFLPVALSLSSIFPWATQTVEPASLARYYLNAPSFLIRAAIALIGFSVLAILIVTERCTRLAAGLGLAFYGLIINLIAVDWILSIQPGFGSSAFGAEIAIQQLLSALAVTALIGPERSGGTVADDLGGLLIATILGVFYIGLMTFIVGWYGNLPAKAAWYLARSENGWAGVIGAAVLLGAVTPLALLLQTKTRGSRDGLRIVGALALIGVALHTAWLMGPALTPLALIAAAIAFIALAFLSVGLAGRVLSIERSPPLHV